MGVSQLEAGFLSRQAAAEEFSSVLRQPAKYRRSQFYVSSASQGDYRSEMDCRKPGRIPLRSQSSSGHHTYQAVKEDGGFHPPFPQHHRASGPRRETRTATVPTASK